MQTRRSLPGFLLRAAITGLALAFVITWLLPDAGSRLRRQLGVETPVPAAVTTTAPAETGAPPAVTSYAGAVQHAAPSVVSVYVNKLVTERTFLIPNPTLQRFSGITMGAPRQRLQRAQGSGVLVSSDGYLLTNHHVIDGADDIQIVLWDGRVTPATVTGTDPDTDLAVLKIEGSHLPAIALEQSPALQVGDVVLAIGNPFGLGQTVTQGIVSGLARSQALLSGSESHSNFPTVDFIQTDAAINSGNSGGALVDAYGRLVGINTFVLGRMSMDAEGIGFAIPAATAAGVLEQIIRNGKVIRGWLGAEYVDVPVRPGTPPAETPHGVILSGIYRNGPAFIAGLQPGDVLLSMDGSDIIDQFDLRSRETALEPGTEVRFSGLRAGVPFDIEAEVIERPDPARG